MRHLHRLLLVVPVIAFAGCSYLTRFVVRNESSAPLRVTWKTDGRVSTPYICRNDQVDRSRDWKGMQPDRWGSGEQGEQWAVIEPGEALNLHSETNFRPLASGQEQYFRLERLVLEGVRGKEEKSDSEVYPLFTRRSDDLFDLRYR